VNEVLYYLKERVRQGVAYPIFDRAGIDGALAGHYVGVSGRSPLVRAWVQKLSSADRGERRCCSRFRWWAKSAQISLWASPASLLDLRIELSPSTFQALPTSGRDRSGWLIAGIWSLAESLVMRATLSEEGLRSLLGGAGLEMLIESKSPTRGTEHRQQGEQRQATGSLP
jgi:hypothetical protein